MSDRKNRALYYVLAWLMVATLPVFSKANAAQQITLSRISPPEDILFIGNSLTFYNGGLSNMLEALATSEPSSRDLFLHQITASGAKLAGLSGEANQYISARAWDVVILQEYSNLPIEDYMAFEEGIDSMMLDIRLQRIQPVFFMTWAYKDQPQMLSGLQDAYIRAANDYNALVVPVGVAFSAASNEYPDINLFHDEKHPSVAGTYLAACVFYASLFDQPSQGKTFYSSLPKEQALALQKVADKVVKTFYGR